jgi:nitroreductase
MIMNQMNQTIIDAFHFRHATKEFDSTKKISDEDFNTILETGRLSPSSLGLEPWHFVVVQNKELREKLKAYSWGAQKQLDTASHFVLIFARKNVTAHTDYVQHLLRGVKKYEESTIPAVENKFDDFQESFHIADNERTLYDWASKQTYIALANMMTSAATGKIYAGFGAKVVGYDAYPNHSLSFLEYKETVEDAIKDADIISLHVPANKDSFHLFDNNMFKKVKKGAVLVNAARGAVINTPDLIEAVNNGTLSGAAIDTYENEANYFTFDWSNQTIEDPILLELIRNENILVTPHIAFFSDEAVQNLVEGGLNAALSVINTGTCDTRLN